MLGPAGILALCLAATTPPDVPGCAWATDEPTEVQATGFQSQLTLEPSAKLSLSVVEEYPSPAVELRVAGDRVVPATLQDIPSIQSMFQDFDPFREEAEPGPMPPAPPGARLPGLLSDDPAYRDGMSPDAARSPFREEEPGCGLSCGEATCGEATCGKATCGEATCGTCDRLPPGALPVCSRGEDLRRWYQGISVESWIEQGITFNTDSPGNRSNFPVGFNDRSNDYQLNQGYLLIEKPVHSCRPCWDFGGRVDLLYGTDSIFTTARGLETGRDLSPRWNSGRYGLALPQLYAEIHAPWGNGVTMKLGRFYTILGYESVPAVDNFFYSHSYALQYAEPITHTGMLASTSLGHFTFHGGITRGWDNWEDNNNDLELLGAMDWTSHDGCTVISMGVSTGREQDEPPSTANARTLFSLVYQRRVTDRLQYVAQYDQGFEKEGAAGGRDADWYGLNQYLLYTLNSCWRFGTRLEFFRDEDGARVDPGGRSGNYYAWSLGCNWTPNERVLVRPEFRWDVAEGLRPFADGRQRGQILAACDFIVRF